MAPLSLVVPLLLFQQAWSAQKCDAPEIYGWAAAAEAWAVANTNYNLSSFKRHVLAMPFMLSCGWAGLGSVGCGSVLHMAAGERGENSEHVEVLWREPACYAICHICHEVPLLCTCRAPMQMICPLCFMRQVLLACSAGLCEVAHHARLCAHPQQAT